MLITANLIAAGTLFVAPSHPALVRSPDRNVWISSQETVEAQAAGNDIVLKARSTGLVHATGLERGAAKPTRVLSVTDGTYAARLRCPRAKVDWSGALPRPQKYDAETLTSLKKCGFDAFELPESPSKEFINELEARESRLDSRGLRIRHVETRDGQRHLRVAAQPAYAKKRLQEELEHFLPFYAVEYSEPPKLGRTLVFEVTLFEFSRAKAASLGVRWPRTFMLQSLEGQIWRGATSENIRDGYSIGMDMGESLGLGRILARPQIRTKPGEKAMFQSGGEIPIVQSTQYAQKTEWRNYGLLLTLIPEANVQTGADEITVGFKLELSEPDASTAVGKMPGMKTRRLESRFDLRTSVTTVLTTLIQTRTSSMHEGVAGLRTMPVLQALFGHKDRSEQDSELWFAIRPSWEEISPP